MKKRLTFIPVVFALAVALLTPTSTLAAGGYTFTVVDQHCIGSGHNIYFRVKETAAGTTPASKLTIKSTSQYFSAGKWHSSYHWATNSSSFTPDGTAHSIDYSYTHENDHGSTKWRIKSVLKAWQGTHVLAHKTLISKAC